MKMCSGALDPTVWGMWAKAVKGLHQEITPDRSVVLVQKKRFKIILIRF